MRVMNRPQPVRRVAVGRSRIALAALLFCLSVQADAAVVLERADSAAGYIARLLVNEVPFPGERGWVSEADTRAAMLAVLWVCHGRIHHVPAGYKQKQVAATTTQNIIDVITVGGQRGQCDGFYRDKNGSFKAVSRVHKRIDRLLSIANKGKPGRFARLLLYAQGVADAYVESGISGADRYAGLKVVNSVKVTGRAYGWMSDKDCYKPGGSFVKIPNANDGSLGGNRFFTLEERKP